jgi:hypothetical protein
MRLTRRTVIWFLLWPLAAASVCAQSEAEKAARAREIIGQAREALGGEALFRSVRSLSASGRLRRFVKFVRVSSPDKVEEKEATLKSKIEFDFLFPDKFRKREKGSDAAGWPYDRAHVVNGGEAWIHPPPPAPSTRQSRMVVSADDAERSYEQQGQMVQADLTLYMLGWLLAPLPTYPVELTHEGEFGTGAGRAHVVNVRGRDGFGAMLFFDPQTRRLTSLMYVVVAPVREEIVVSAVGFSRQYRMQTFARARREAAARARTPRRVEVRINFSDYRPVGGLLVPHRLTWLHDGRTVAELEMSDFALNEPIRPKKFEAKHGR